MTKHSLFQLGSEALRRALNLDVSVYVCPTCLKAFEEHQVNRELTWDHVPPRAIGGKRLVLSCRTCNSRSGHSLDAAMDQRLQQESFLKALARGGHYSGRLMLGMGGERFNVKAEIAERNVGLSILGGLNNPAAVQRLEDTMHRHVEEGTWKTSGTFQLSAPRSYQKKHAQLGDLRVAYLASFALFGYTYILRDPFDRVRAQLQQPSEEVLTRGFWAFLGWQQKPLRAIRLVTDPIPMLFVQIDRTAVVLPHPEVRADPWSRVAQISSGDQLILQGFDLGWPSQGEFLFDFNPPPGLRIEAIRWREVAPEKWEAEWRGFKVEVARLNPGETPERWYWGILGGRGPDLDLSHPCGEALSLDAARSKAIHGVKASGDAARGRGGVLVPLRAVEGPQD